jgi:hypothetical protein
LLYGMEIDGSGKREGIETELEKSFWSTLIHVGYFFHRKNKHSKKPREGPLLTKGVRPDANVEKTNTQSD